VWATDQQGHQVFAWTSEGELLLTLGRAGEEGDPPERLSEPTDVAIAEDGTIFVSEGHSFAAGANRVSKFAPDGTFLESWGSTGSGIGELNVPHTLAIDARGRVLVGDRGNNRIQIFDRDGRFLDVWYEFGRPSGIAIGPGDRLYVADSESWGTDNPGWKKGIRVGSALDGSVDYLIEDLEATSIEHSGAEGVGVDREGNVYGGVVRRRMLERHEPVRGGAEESAPRAAPAGMPPHVAHLAATFPGAPGERGLVAAATTEAGIATLHANLAAGNLSDLGAMRLHARHVLHALAPDGSAERPGTGLGLVRASEAVAAHAEMAAAQPGAREATRTHAGHLMMLARSLAARASEAATVARELASASSIRDAAPLVAELRLLVYRIAEGGDADRDGELALDGEAGLQQLEAHLYLLLEGEGLPRVIR
ncbi:MAG TPA: hypothetical protein VFQ22_02835, partial [Longimicrobiales bacterium]|nr:hypothetical protein [Longimicrobiales bacterium]